LKASGLGSVFQTGTFLGVFDADLGDLNFDPLLGDISLELGDFVPCLGDLKESMEELDETLD
jgi:hypothetical protein